jgi:hypothetical protein
MDEKILHKKFDSLVLEETGKNKRDQIIDIVMNLEKINDFNEFAKILAYSV